jgi:predicted MFS family arabinose efflux permease
VQVRADLGLERMRSGRPGGRLFGGAALGSLLGGRTADRLGAQWSCARLPAWAPSRCWPRRSRPDPLLLGVVLAVAGAASGAGQPRRTRSSRTPWPATAGRPPYGAKQAAIPAGVLLGGLAVPVFGVTVGWRWAYVAGGVLALLVPLLVPPPRAAPGDGPTRRRGSSNERAAQAAGPFRRGPLLVLAVGTTLGAAVGNAVGAFFVETCGRRRPGRRGAPG